MKFKAISGDTHIVVEGSLSLFKSLISFDFFRKYIPDSQLIELNEDEKDVGLTVIDSVNDLDFSFDRGHGILKCFVDRNISLEAVIVVIDYCLEYQRQKNGVFCIHGSAVSLDGKGILILGGVSGLGKTTLALNLCLKHNAKFIGDDKVLVSREGFIVGGAKKIEFNKTALFSSVGAELNNKDIDKLQEIIQIEDTKIQISVVVQPSIFLGSNFEFEKWDVSKASFHFYEELSRKIRGTSKRISNSTYPLDSLDTKEIALMRSDFVNILTKETPFISLKGNINEVMKRLIDFL